MIKCLSFDKKLQWTEMSLALILNSFKLEQTSAQFDPDVLHKAKGCFTMFCLNPRTSNQFSSRGEELCMVCNTVVDQCWP